MGDRLKPLPPHMEDEICSSRLQLVLLSPTLLQFLYRQPSLLVGRLLHPDRVIAIMLGVRDGQIQAEHRRSLVSFSQWIHLEAKDHDLEFVQTVLYFSTQILQRSTHKTQMPSIVRKTSGRSQSHERQLVKQQQQNELKLNTYSLARSASNSQNHHGHRSTTESNLFHLHPRVVSEVRFYCFIDVAPFSEEKSFFAGSQPNSGHIRVTPTVESEDPNHTGEKSGRTERCRSG